jgi:hypothetical protein
MYFLCLCEETADLVNHTFLVGSFCIVRLLCAFAMLLDQLEIRARMIFLITGILVFVEQEF